MEINEESLKELRIKCYPCGSGPLGMMAIVTRLIDYIATKEGWDVGQVKNPYPPVKRRT